MFQLYSGPPTTPPTKIDHGRFQLLSAMAEEEDPSTTSRFLVVVGCHTAPKASVTPSTTLIAVASTTPVTGADTMSVLASLLCDRVHRHPQQRRYTDVDFSLVAHALDYLGADKTTMQRVRSMAQSAVTRLDATLCTYYSAFNAFGTVASSSSVTVERCATVMERFPGSVKAATYVTAHGLGTETLTTVEPTTGAQHTSVAQFLGVPHALLDTVHADPRAVIAGGAAVALGCPWISEIKPFSDLDIFFLSDDNKDEEEGTEEDTESKTGANARPTKRVRRCVAMQQEEDTSTTPPPITDYIQILHGAGYVFGTRSPSVLTAIPTTPGHRTVQLISTSSTTVGALLGGFEINACRAALASPTAVTVSCDALIDWGDKICRGSCVRQVRPVRLIKMKLKGFTLTPATEEHIKLVAGPNAANTLAADIEFGYPRYEAHLPPREAQWRLQKHHGLKMYTGAPSTWNLIPLCTSWIVSENYCGTQRDRPVTLRPGVGVGTALCNSISVCDVNMWHMRPGPPVQVLGAPSEYAARLPPAVVAFVDIERGSVSKLKINVPSTVAWASYRDIARKVMNHALAITRDPNVKTIFNDPSELSEDRLRFQDIRLAVNCTTRYMIDGIPMAEEPDLGNIHAGQRVRVDAITRCIVRSKGDYGNWRLQLRWEATSINFIGGIIQAPRDMREIKETRVVLPIVW